MNKLLIAAGVLAMTSTGALADDYAYKLGPGSNNNSKIIQDNSVERCYGYRCDVTQDRYARGNDAYTAQLGWDNSNLTVQSGDANYQYLYQNGGWNSNQTWQFGHSNFHIGVQDGIDHSAVVAQYGDYNGAKTFQFGSKNRAAVVQAGANRFMKPHLQIDIAVKAEKTYASFWKEITKPGTYARGGGKWEPRDYRPRPKTR